MISNLGTMVDLDRQAPLSSHGGTLDYAAAERHRPARGISRGAIVGGALLVAIACTTGLLGAGGGEELTPTALLSLRAAGDDGRLLALVEAEGGGGGGLSEQSSLCKKKDVIVTLFDQLIAKLQVDPRLSHPHPQGIHDHPRLCLARAQPTPRCSPPFPSLSFSLLPRQICRIIESPTLIPDAWPPPGGNGGAERNDRGGGGGVYRCARGRVRGGHLHRKPPKTAGASPQLLRSWRFC